MATCDRFGQICLIFKCYANVCFRDKPITAPVGPKAAMGRMLPISRPAVNDGNGPFRAVHLAQLLNCVNAQAFDALLVCT
jgi:hypothetical protein